MNQPNNLSSSLPHHRLVVYRKALELLAAVRAAQVRDAKLRDEAYSIRSKNDRRLFGTPATVAGEQLKYFWGFPGLSGTSIRLM